MSCSLCVHHSHPWRPALTMPQRLLDLVMLHGVYTGTVHKRHSRPCVAEPTCMTSENTVIDNVKHVPEPVTPSPEIPHHNPKDPATTGVVTGSYITRCSLGDKPVHPDISLTLPDCRCVQHRCCWPTHHLLIFHWRLSNPGPGCSLPCRW